MVADIVIGGTIIITSDKPIAPNAAINPLVFEFKLIANFTLKSIFPIFF